MFLMLTLKGSIEFEEDKSLLSFRLKFGFVWQKLQSILLLQGSLPMPTNERSCKLNWCLNDETYFKLTQITF